jgi:hypothetical protein
MAQAFIHFSIPFSVFHRRKSGNEPNASGSGETFGGSRSSVMLQQQQQEERPRFVRFSSFFLICIIRGGGGGCFPTFCVLFLYRLNSRISV